MPPRKRRKELEHHVEDRVLTHDELIELKRRAWLRFAATMHRDDNLPPPPRFDRLH